MIKDCFIILLFLAQSNYGMVNDVHRAIVLCSITEFSDDNLLFHLLYPKTILETETLFGNAC